MAIYKEDSFQNYLTFATFCFGDSLSDRHFTDKYKRFETIMIELYKTSEIITGKKMVLPEEQQYDFTKKVEIAFQTEINKIFKYFKFSNCEDFQPIIKAIYLNPIIIPVSEINDEFIKNFLSEYLKQGAFSYLNLILEEIIKPKTVLLNQKGKVSSFLSEVKNIGSIDTVVGNLNLFSSEEDNEVFKKFCKGKNIINDTNYGDKIIAVNSNLLRIMITDINVHLSDYSEIDLKNICELDEQGNYLYNITNSIFIPFKKEELMEHIHNTKKILAITSNIKFITKSEKIGGGNNVSFDRPIYKSNL